MGRYLATLGILLTLIVGARFAGLAPQTLPDPALTPADALLQVSEGTRKLDLRPWWENLPPSWQADIDGIVQAMRAHQDLEMWALGMQALGGAAELLSLPAKDAPGLDQSVRIAKWLGVDADQPTLPAQILEQRWRVAAALNTVVGSPFADPTNLEYLDVRELLGVLLPQVQVEFQKLAGPKASLLGSVMEGALADFSKAARDAQTSAPLQTDFSVDWLSPTYATTVTTNVRLVNIEDRWVPDLVAERLPENIKAMQAQVAAWSAETPGDAPETDYVRQLLNIVIDHTPKVRAAVMDPTAFDLALDALVSDLAAAIVGHRMRKLFR